MKVLNLTSLANSDIKYKISKFPDGQQNIVIDEDTCYGSKYGYLLMSHEDCVVQIKSRLNNWLDLELIICAVASLRELGVKDIDLYTPYFMGARSDRKFEEGGNWYLRDVICPIINSLGFRYVTVLDPHSSVLGNLIKGFRSIDNKQLVGFALKDLNKNIVDPVSTINKCILVSPDEGASKKIYKLAEQIGYKGDIVTCSKERDTEGKLTKTVVPYHSDLICGDLSGNKDVIIIDDICDGGRTFINIAKEIKEDTRYTGNKIYLIVTHGIFSAGFGELSKYFDGIYSTNSYRSILTGEDYKFKQGIKQLNIF